MRAPGSVLAVLAALVLAGALAVSAQTTEPPVDYEAWGAVAERAEVALEERSASTAALGELRTEIADWRADFLAAEAANQTRISTIQSQIAALGPAPAEGESEPIEIANRRAELNAQLDRLRAPQVAATEAYNRADGLVGELDQVIRDRQTERLLELGPSPLNPTVWEQGLRLLGERVMSLGREVTRAASSPAQMALAREALPLTGFLTIVGMMLFINGRRWMQRATAAVHRRESAAGRVALGFVVSLGQIVLPVLGLLALSQAAVSTGLLGLRSEELVKILPGVGLFIYGALWLGARVFPPGEGMPGPLDLTENLRAKGRKYSAALGFLLSLSLIVGTLFDFDSEAEGAAVIFSFPLLVLIGVALFRMGRFLTQSVRTTEEIAPETGLRLQLTRLLGRATMAVGLVGPVAAAAGYENFSASIVFPAALSLALIGTLVILYGPIRDLYAAITGRTPEDAGDALVPVLISFFLALASTPLFALIWGVRPAELAEIWARFVAGVTLGETRISPSDLLVVVVVFGLGYGVTRLVQGALRTTVLPRTRLDLGGRNAIVSGVGYVGIFLAGLIAITAAGINLSSLAIFASALAVGVGFGLQNIVSNFVSGIILLIERPISEGDWVEVGGQMGYVRDISVRSTRIETFDRTDVIVPNADFVSGTVINYTRGNLIGRVIVPVGVAYGTDTRQVEKILQEIAEAHPMVLLNPKPNVVFQGFGADSLDFEIRAILRDVNWVLSVKSDMNHEIARRFTEEGIEIPFAQRDVWLRNPEALASRATPPEDEEKGG